MALASTALRSSGTRTLHADGPSEGPFSRVERRRGGSSLRGGRGRGRRGRARAGSSPARAACGGEACPRDSQIAGAAGAGQNPRLREQTPPFTLAAVKTARVYGEIAAFLASHGYAQAGEWAVNDWRRRGLLPSLRGLGRSRRPAGRLPVPVKERALAISRYRYDLGLRDLRRVTLLLWLDGEAVPLPAVRRALEAVRGVAERLVRMTGDRARRTDPEDQDPDVFAAAEAVARMDLPTMVGGEKVDADELHASAFDAMQLALHRRGDLSAESFAPLARAIGLGRAAKERVNGAGPWLSDDPGSALASALRGLFGVEAATRLASTTDRGLLRARDTANELHRVLTVSGQVFRLGYPKGTAGLGFLTLAANDPLWLRPCLVFIAILLPSESQAFVGAFSETEIRDWEEATEVAAGWLNANRERQADVESRGLVAVLAEELGRPAETA
jgi:hypothetical protein